MPKLRFRDKCGNNYPKFQPESVGTLFNNISHRNTAMENNNVITNSAEYGLIPQREFFDKNIAVEGNTDKYYIIEQGDFVYNPRKSTSAPYGPFNCYKYPEEGIVSPLYTCLRPIYNEYTDYLLWYFRSSSWHSYIYHNGAQGGARHDRVGMTNDLMKGIPIYLPCLEEQKKISAFLSVFELRIEKQRQLVELLRSYKKGALSKLFPQNGETTPEYRFAGFTEPWKRCKLGDLLKYEQPKMYMVESTEYNDKFKTPVLTAGQSFILGYTAEEFGIKKASPTFPIIIFDDFTTSSHYVDFPFKVKSSAIKLLTLNKQEDNIYFTFNLLNNVKYIPISHERHWISTFSQLDVLVPDIKQEQQLLGNLLHMLDDLITLYQCQLNKSQLFKAGLIQKLFI